MHYLLKTSLGILLITAVTGCSEKRFTLQSYADRWFNDKEKTQAPTTQNSASEENRLRKSENETTSNTPHLQSKNSKPQEQADIKISSTPNKTATTPPQTSKPDLQDRPTKTTRLPEVVARAKAEPTNNPGKSEVGASIAPSSVNKRDAHMQGEGAMQSNLDTWMKEEWEPTFEGDEEQAKKDEAANKHFTLQHYVDKYNKYSKAKEEAWKKSGKQKPEAHYEKMEKLPVIGK